MREYPRRVYKTQEDSKRVFSEFEEIEAALDGYECHFDPEVVKDAKGTDFEILRGTAIKEETITVLTEVKKKKGK